MRLFGTEKYPKGPSFRSATQMTKDLGVGRLTFMAPKPKPAFGGRWAEEPDVFDIASSDHYEVEQAWDEKPIDALQRLRVYSNTWEFRGLPLIKGYAGHINCLVDVHRIKDLPANESLFDSNVLALQVLRNHEFCVYSEVVEGFTDAPLDTNPDKWPDVLGPVNCQWVERNGNEWLYAEEQPLSRTARIVTWSTPLTHEHYLSFLFLVQRSSTYGPNAYRIEQRVRPDTFIELMHNIMDSVTLELRDDIKAEGDRIRARENTENERPVIQFTPEQLEVAKHVMYMCSTRKLEDTDDQWNSAPARRAPRAAVETFLEERVKFKPLPGSYPRGEIIYNRVPVLPITRLLDSQPQSSLEEKVNF